MRTLLELIIVAALYAGGAAAMIRAFFLRREALSAWRRAIGGAFDRVQHRFATELDLDGARLPPDARALLLASRKALVAGFGVLALSLVLHAYVLLGG